MQAKRQKRQPITLDDASLTSVHGGEAPSALETTTIGANDDDNENGG